MRRAKASQTALAVLWVGFAWGHAWADESPLWNPEFLSLHWENDKFAWAENRDRHYTNGLRLALLSRDTRERRGSDLDDGLARALGLLGTGEGWAPSGRRLGLAVGQSIFTPDDTETAAPIETDRPYAGWTYLALSAHGTFESGGVAREDVVQLQLGIVGRHAYAEEVQNNFHDVLSQAHAAGWAHQLGDEPGVNVVVQSTWRSRPYEVTEVIGADALPHLGMSLGNVHTFGSGGLLLRLGTGLERDFGPPRIFPGLPGSETFAPGRRFDLYLFAGVDGRLVGRNIFLDGSTFRDSLDVDSRPLVGDVQIGLVGWLGCVRVAYTHVLLTPEFEEQDGYDQFGSFNATFRF